MQGTGPDKKSTNRPHSADKGSQTPSPTGAAAQKSHPPSPPAIPPRKIDVDSNKQTSPPPSTSNVPVEVLSAKSIKVRIIQKSTLLAFCYGFKVL